MAGLPRRIIKDTQHLLAERVPGIQAESRESNTCYFHVVIAGPQDSPFEGRTFKLELFLPEEYAMAAPKVRFMTKIYHPNVDKLGRICLDILKGKCYLYQRMLLLSFLLFLLSIPCLECKHYTKIREVCGREVKQFWACFFHALSYWACCLHR